VVKALANGPKVRVSNPAEDDGFLKAIKSIARFHSDGK
jgi:hypothetical protein